MDFRSVPPSHDGVHQPEVPRPEPVSKVVPEPPGVTVPPPSPPGYAEILRIPNQIRSDKDPGSSIPIRTPGRKAISGTLEIGRTLRPLMRKVPSRHRMVLDVDATVSRVVELGNWDAVVRPALTRWLNVTVVVDVSDEMLVWRETARELVGLLAQHGAFSGVRVWRLDARSSEDPVFFASDGGARRNPRELI